MRFIRRTGLLLACLWAAGRAAGDEPQAPVPEPPWAQVREATFTQVWETVNEAYYDPGFGGVDWAAVGAKYRGGLEACADGEQLRALLRGMLGELGRTHFAVLPRESAVFMPAERDRIGTTGAELVAAGREVTVAEVRADSSAARQGLEPGDVVVAVGGQDLGQLRESLERSGLTGPRLAAHLTGFAKSWLQAAVGTEVSLAVTDARGARRDLKLVCGPHEGAWSEPVGSFPAEPIRLVTERDEHGLAVLRFNVFAAAQMKGIRAFLRSLRPGDGLVIDLRGNPGGLTGMAAGIAGLITEREFSLGRMTMRRGFLNFAVYPQERAFGGPVAVLVDSGSASTSEILAAGLQEAGRARVFGEPTPGAALPSSFKTLPTGDLFQYAVADLKTPGGRMLEGGGVQPDEVVAWSAEDLRAGRDPVLEAARTWIGRQIKAAGSASGAARKP